jgi:riboflavin kinase/FMN adenylyltransferase
MKIIYKKLPPNHIECVATVGVFDGIHKGHQFILKKLKQISHKQKLPTLLITFDTTPQKILEKNKSIFLGILNNCEQKRRIIKKMKIDYIWFLKINKKFLKLSGNGFLNYIFRYIKIKKLIVGHDFRFGYKGLCAIGFLKKVSKKYDFKLVVVKKIKEEGRIISSTLIRKLIKKGKIKEANFFLTRPYCLEGRVIKGIGYASRLGFPTANLSVKDYVVPRPGVYSGFSRVDNRNYICAINIGTRPTLTKSKKIIVEAHMLKFKNRNLYGKRIEICLFERIRPEKKFASEAELKEAITKDIKYISKNIAAKIA